MFDNQIISYLNYYVYALFDPKEPKKPFYIGKGKGNRVFSHVDEAIEAPKESDKLNKIREIKERGDSIKYLILRHDLSEDEAFLLEATMIDTLDYLGINLSNKIQGHRTITRGIMTTDEIRRLYKVEPLNEIRDDAIIININKLHKRGSNSDEILQQTKKAWVIGAKRRNITKFVLAEYKGLIIEVFEIIGEWYKVPSKYKSGDKKGEDCTRWGFEGEIADSEIRDLYLNKSIAHHKKRGQANPIRCNL